MLASHIPHIHLLSSNFPLFVTHIVLRFLISFHFFSFSPTLTLTVFQSLLSSSVCQGSKELKSYCFSGWDQILTERLTEFHIHHHFKVGDIAIDENKTISDGGITVDFSIIKVHTGSWRGALARTRTRWCVTFARDWASSLLGTTRQ